MNPKLTWRHLWESKQQGGLLHTGSFRRNRALGWGKQEERVWAPCGMEDEALCSLTQLGSVPALGKALERGHTQLLPHPNCSALQGLSRSAFMRRRNLVESVTKDYLKKCTYHKVTDSLCPVFGLGYVVKESGQNFTVLAVKVLDVQRRALGHREGGTGLAKLPLLQPGVGFPRALHGSGRIKSLKDNESPQMWPFLV